MFLVNVFSTGPAKGTEGGSQFTLSLLRPERALASQQQLGEKSTDFYDLTKGVDIDKGRESTQSFGSLASLECAKD